MGRYCILAYSVIYIHILVLNIIILTDTRSFYRSQNVSCQVTEMRHKGVKRKGNRNNRNPATVGMSIMKTELEEAACQRMAQALDESGKMHVCVCICMYNE